MTKHEFCYICGNKVEQRSSNCWWCNNCKQEYYDNPRACAELVLYNSKGEILICERAFEPHKGALDLPGGFMEASESIEEAMYREISEELSLEKSDISSPVYVTSWPYRYPWGKETYDVITFTFTAQLLTDKHLHPTDDVASLSWMKPDDIPVNKLSVPVIKDIIDRAVAARVD